MTTKSASSNSIRFDAHCHIFDLDYAFKEIKSIFHEIKLRKEKTDALSLHGFPGEKGLDDLLDDLRDFIKQLSEIFKAGKGDEEKNLNFLIEQGNIAFNGSDFRIIPLMMDINYIFSKPLGAGEDLSVSHNLYEETFDSKLFEPSWLEFLDSIDTTGDNKLKKAIEAEKESAVGFLKLSTMSSFTFYQTNGFCHHMNKLLELTKNQKDKLYPFIAIDPRRRGIIDDLQNHKFTQGDSRFYGVKLYPRLGYHPLCKPLEKVYAYCEKNDIPITVHCSIGGFPGNDWRNWDWSDPKLYESVLNTYPNLRMNFAHFGNSDNIDEKKAWRKTIISYMKPGNHIYTDLSCYTDPNALDDIPELLKNFPILKERILYGTDFDVMFFTHLFTNMSDYHQKFKNALQLDLIKMMNENPIAFLGPNAKI